MQHGVRHAPIAKRTHLFSCAVAVFALVNLLSVSNILPQTQTTDDITKSSSLSRHPGRNISPSRNETKKNTNQNHPGEDTPLSFQDYWQLQFTNNNRSSIAPRNSSKFLCTGKGFWGDNSNRILQLANMMEMRSRTGYARVALTRPWSHWYQQWFDPLEDDIVFGVRTRWCGTSVSAREALNLLNKRFGNPVLPFFVPKRSIREEAQQAVLQLKQELGVSRFVSVHRRSLVDSCRVIATEGDKFFYCLGDNVSMTVRERALYCKVTYTDMLRLAASEAGRNSTTTKPHEGAPFVLFTDGKRPELDNTFPIIDNHSFPVQMWMMVLSDAHYGNPLSSVDYVVAHWRRGRNIHPHECYKAYSDTFAF